MGSRASRRGQGLTTCWPGQVGPGQVFGITEPEPAAHLSKRVADHVWSAKAGTRDLVHPSRPGSASAMQSPPNRQPPNSGLLARIATIPVPECRCAAEMMGGWKLERQPHDCTTTSNNAIMASHRVWALPPRCYTVTGTAQQPAGHAWCSTRTLRAPNNIQTWCIAATPQHTCTTSTHTHPHTTRRWEQRLIGPW